MSGFRVGCPEVSPTIGFAGSVSGVGVVVRAVSPVQTLWGPSLSSRGPHSKFLNVFSLKLCK